MPWSCNSVKFVVMLLAATFSNSTLAQNGGQTPSTQIVQPAAPLQPAPRASPLVIIDAAHGGSESGALLNPAIPEKDVTLVFAIRLREELGSRGISSQLIRDNDATITTDQRAEMVDSIRPVLYICLHASSLGAGIRVFTAMHSSASGNRGPFVNWNAAHADAETKSLYAQQQVSAALMKSGLAVRTLPAPLRPLNNITVPALAFELAPVNGNVSQLTSVEYQQTTCAALANAIATVLPALRSRAVAP